MRFSRKEKTMEKRKGKMLALMMLAILLSQKPDIAHAASYTVAYEYDGLPADTKANCVAFARHMVPSLPGGLYTLEDKKKHINSHTARAGVIAITNGNSSAGHVAYVESVKGNQVTTLNGGFESGAHIERITGTEGEQGILGYWYPSNIASDTQPPVISNIGLSDITRDGYTVTCTVTDNVGVTSVKFPSWNTNMDGSDIWLEGARDGDTASIRVNLADLKSGPQEGYYMTHIYAYDGAGNVSSAAINNGYPLLIDRTPPEISEVSVELSGSSGYWVNCKVSDNLEQNIDRVQFPTWTLSQGQDDLPQDWPYNSEVSGRAGYDGRYRFFVSTLAHNGEKGPYQTHIYAYDKYGNVGAFGGLEDIEIPDDGIAPVILDKEVTIINGDTVHVKVSASDNMELGELVVEGYKASSAEELVKLFVNGYSSAGSMAGEFVEPSDGVYEFDLGMKTPEGWNYYAIQAKVYDIAGNSTKVFEDYLFKGKTEQEVKLKSNGEAFDFSGLFDGCKSQNCVFYGYDKELLEAEGGKIQPLKAGNTEIYVWDAAMGKLYPPTYVQIVENTTINLSQAQLTLTGTGTKAALSAEVTPVNTKDKSLKWSSSNPAVATVDQSGNVTAVSDGTASILAVSNEDGQSASCKVTVNVPAGNKPESPKVPNAPKNPGTSVAPNAAGSQAQNTVTIVFHENGGKNLSRRTITVKKNQFVGSLPTVQRKGYLFRGWFTAPTGGTKLSAYTRATVSQTVYAQWKKVTKPKKTAISSLKRKGKGKFTVKYKKISGADGYEISYSTNKRFQSATKKIRTSSLAKTVKGLKKNRNYYVRIRAYKEDSIGSKIYGSYSKSKRVKV